MGSFIDPRSPENESQEPVFRAPAIVGFIIAALGLVHIAAQFLDQDQFVYLIQNFAFIPAFFLQHVASGSISDWAAALFSTISYAFLHGSWTHLIFNSLWFLVFATPVARRIGSLRCLVLLLVTTLAAALAHLIVFWNSPIPVVGASGAVSGLMGAAFRFIFAGSAQYQSRPPALSPLFSRQVLLPSAIWIVLNAVLGLIGLTPEGIGESIAWEAHLGGFLAGIILFPLFDRQRRWLR